MTRLSPLLLAVALQAAQGPTPQQIRDSLDAIAQQLGQLIEAIPRTPPITTAAQLQASLDAGGNVDLPPGNYAGHFVISKSGTRLVARAGATLTGTTGPALYIKPGAGISDVLVDGPVMTSSTSGAVLQCGDNVASSQGTAALVPQRIVLRNITIPTHRGKRGIEFNCSGTIENPQIADVWSRDGQDSQAIWIANTCGPVRVLGGDLVAGSENLMSGGDTPKVRDCPEGVVADIEVNGTRLSKPDIWRSDTENQNEKNLLEIKAGKRVRLLNIIASGSWGPKQDGSAFVLTPKNGQVVEDVLIDNATVDRAAGGLQLLGKDYNSTTPRATSQVVVRNSRFTLSRSYGGRGILAIVTGGMLDATFENVTATFDGNAIFICDTPAGHPIGPLTVRGSTLTTGPYGVMANGVNYGGAAPANYAGRECQTTFEGNTLTGAPTRFRQNFPSNVYQ